jgi:hypothetical protein
MISAHQVSFKAIYINAGLDIRRPLHLLPEMRELYAIDTHSGPEFIGALLNEARAANMSLMIQNPRDNVLQKVYIRDINLSIMSLTEMTPLIFENEEAEQRIYYFHSASLSVSGYIIRQWIHTVNAITNDHQIPKTIICGLETPPELLMDFLCTLRDDADIYYDLVTFRDSNIEFDVDDAMEMEEEEKYYIPPNILRYFTRNDMQLRRTVVFPFDVNYFRINDVNDTDPYNRYIGSSVEELVETVWSLNKNSDCEDENDDSDE